MALCSSGGVLDPLIPPVLEYCCGGFMSIVILAVAMETIFMRPVAKYDARQTFFPVRHIKNGSEMSIKYLHPIRVT